MEDEQLHAGVHGEVLATPEWNGRMSMIHAGECTSAHDGRWKISAFAVGRRFSDSSVPHESTADESKRRGRTKQVVAQ